MRPVHRKKLVLLCLLLVGCASMPMLPGPDRFVVTLHAQALPVSKTLVWDASADATGYVVTQDGATIGSPTGTSQGFTVTTAGSHTFTVTAVNVWGSSAPATLTVNVVVPGKPANLGVR